MLTPERAAGPVAADERRDVAGEPGRVSRDRVGAGAGPRRRVVEQREDPLTALRGFEHEVVVVGEIEHAGPRLDLRPAELLPQPPRAGRRDDLRQAPGRARPAPAGDVRVEADDLSTGDRVSKAVQNRLAAGDAPALGV